MSGNSQAGPSLEADLSLLMSALHNNNSEDWQGKPNQETFQVYNPTPANAQDVRASSSTLKVENTAADAKTLSSGVRDEVGGGDPRASLDMLMSEYVSALRGLRTATATADSCADSTSDQLNVKDEKRCSYGEGEVKDAELQDFLDALDQLPPLTKK